jgi:predicted DCC family thiol-disulfide oxidoreductase YuxK
MPAGRPSPGQRFIVLYDDDCGFCKTLLAVLLAWDRRGRLRPLALQREEAAQLLGDLTPEERMESWHLVSPAGTRWSAGAAFAPLLRLLPAGAGPAIACERFPLAAERGYRWVADRRSALSHLLPGAVKRAASAHVHRRETQAD